MTRAPARPVRAWLDGLTPARRGAVIFITAGLVFICGDALIKSLVAHLSVVDVLFGRHLSYLVLVVLLAGRSHPRRLLATSRPWTQLLRGLAMFGSTAMYFVSLSLLPMAESSALGSTEPLIVLVLAGPVLGERVRRVAAVGGLIGFVGVLLLVGLGPPRVNVAVAAPLASALLLAIFRLLTRSLRTDPAEVTVFLSGVVGMVAAAVLLIVIPVATPPQPIEWLAIGVVGVTSLAGHSLLVLAYRWGRASDMAPLGYLTLLWSFLVGAIVFGETPAVSAVAGALAIALGGVLALRSRPPDETPLTIVDYAGPVDQDGG